MVKTCWLWRFLPAAAPHIITRQALVNALIHRDYIVLGSEIHIDMFDDRVEITSPGGMFGGGSPIGLIKNAIKNKINPFCGEYVINTARALFSSRENSFCKAMSKSYASWAFFPRSAFPRRSIASGGLRIRAVHGMAGKCRSRSRRPCGCSRCTRRNTRYTIAPWHGRRQKR